MSDTHDGSQSKAVGHLVSLGLSTYAARTFVALTQIGRSTAQGVSEAADVPRTRVYDAVDELHEHGLVDVRQSTPREFRAVSIETATEHFAHEYHARIDALSDSLDTLPSGRKRTAEQRGVWTVTGRDVVSERVVEFLQAAEDEVVYMTVEDLLTDDIVEELRAASDRGVSIRAAGISNAVEDDIRDAVPDVDLFESMWDWSETPAGRLLMVDGSRTLVSVRGGNGGTEADLRDETAIWGSGEANSLVMVLRAMFTWELD